MVAAPMRRDRCGLISTGQPEVSMRINSRLFSTTLIPRSTKRLVSIKQAEIDNRWHIVDADGLVLGRLASKVAQVIRGKHKPTFTPHMDCGDFVVVVNADKVRLTGRKMDQKAYFRHTGFIGNEKFTPVRSMLTQHPERVIEKAVYGMPELYRGKIRKARLVANPGCYPTSTVLGLLPAIKNRLIGTKGIVVDSKSGTSGAGRSLNTAFLFCEVNDGFRAYGLASHRHTPEIEQELSVLAGQKVTVDFTPHLVPMDRGILTTIYAPLRNRTGLEKIHAIYRRAYGREPFVRVLPPGQFPVTKNVRGTNDCHIGMQVNPRTKKLIIVSAIDNLTKGAAGQAVHNMNLMMGWPETAGLEGMAVFP